MTSGHCRYVMRFLTPRHFAAAAIGISCGGITFPKR
jgi:hypothetical protein